MKTAKAVVAAAMAALTALSTGLTDGKLTPEEVWIALLALVTTYGGTWFVPNAGTVSSAALEREVIRARYSHTTYGGSAGAPPDAGLPPNERPEVQ